MIGLGISLIVFGLFLGFCGIQAVRARLWSSWHQEFSRKMGIVLLVLGSVALVAGIVVTIMSLVE